MNREGQIDEWIRVHREEMIEELMDFVRHPSVSRADLCKEGAPYGPDVKAMLDFALQRGHDFGFRAENHDGYCGSVWYGDQEEESASMHIWMLFRKDTQQRFTTPKVMK